MKQRLLTFTAALGLAAALAPAAHADTLQDIKARGKFICGTMGTAEPFSFQDPKTRAIVGYEVDMCQVVADSLGVPLELKLIAVEARIPELIAGRVDVVAANLGWSPERAQQIDYSHQHFVSLQKVLARDSDKDLKAPADLAGKRVSAVRGSSSEQGARFLALQQGKVAGFVGSELMLVKLKQQAAASAVPAKILEPALFVEPWGMGVRRGDSAMLGQVNKVLDGLEASGKAAQIFDKWFGAGTPFNMKRDFRIEAIKG